MVSVIAPVVWTLVAEPLVFYKEADPLIDYFPELGFEFGPTSRYWVTDVDCAQECGHSLRIFKTLLGFAMLEHINIYSVFIQPSGDGSKHLETHLHRSPTVGTCGVDLVSGLLHRAIVVNDEGS